MKLWLTDLYGVGGGGGVLGLLPMSCKQTYMFNINNNLDNLKKKMRKKQVLLHVALHQVYKNKLGGEKALKYIKKG